ncbi:MAG TPA: hypothetical protein VKV40_15415 [Ktedonobacteraceae bacterium]|nr:hypothetical protein [Ktedonobacteraceae bacterium]
MILKRTFAPLFVLFLMLALTACGSSSTSGSTTGSTSTNSNNGSTSTAASASTPTSTSPSPTSTSPSSNALIETASATVKGKAETILTDAQGKTLYYFTPDTATTSACTGSCAQTWPPLLMTGSGSPTSAASLPGSLSVQTTANGSQVEYNGHMLYTYAGDSAPGQTNGEGLFGKWFVATPDLSNASSSTNSGY